ncbi:response regulator [Chondrinema litorale]|uniref:response regulator n=1 Tax=Chondrinema litorale TaxID=2994555 RepID=UPI002542C4DE|nr:response regulator [Chondrinema litorale]UZR94994.1 response regulator [Chondrinema litorale]
MEEKKYNVLYVDDEESNLRIFKTAFRRHYNVFIAVTVEEGIDILTENEIHLIVTDQRMPKMSGVEFLTKILPDYPDAVRMILTGFSDVQAIIAAINSGRVYRYITKPWDKDDLKSILDEALTNFEKERVKKETIAVLEQEKSHLENEIGRLKSEIVIKDKIIIDLETKLV